MRRWWSVAVAVGMLGAPSVALAQDDDDDAALESEAEEADEGSDEGKKKDKDAFNDPDDEAGEDFQWHALDFMTFGIGAMGVAGANFLDKPGDQTVGGRDFPEDSQYPGFAGVALGGGLMFEVRFLGYVGLELDVLFQSDRGTADLESTTRDANGNIINREEFTIKIGHRATHLPLLIKGALPGKFVTPVVFLGPEFVIPGDAECEERCTNNPSGTRYGAFSESYTAFAFGLGLEVNLPIPKADIRIPLSLRGNYVPSVAGTRDERANHTDNGTNLTSEEFSTKWKFQAAGTFGAAWHF
ncbi:MAG: hypothetical protein RIF41_17370 [Polyangiaceae bacterium]